MKKLIYFIVVSMMFICRIDGQTSALKFKEDKTFKIVQFTDVHYKYDTPDLSQKALDCMNRVLEVEKPDFVILTGDLVYSEPGIAVMEKVLSPVIAHGIPYAVVWGNHDDEFDVSRAELQKFVEKQPGNIGKTVPELPGYSNFVLTVRSSTDNKEAAVLYGLDSHAYSTLPQVKGYGWISPEQIRWYTEQSRTLTERNNGQPLPALAFFHIPLPEYNLAAADENVRMVGSRWEKACAPVLNTGLYTAMLEAKDVMGVFVGHDHDNDYVMDYKDILLGYGRYTGGKTVYNNLPEGNGARVILLEEGSRTFSTWIRLHTDEIIGKVNTALWPKKE